jgi:hypothetical protein
MSKSRSSRSRSSKSFLERARPWLVAWGIVQMAIRVSGMVMARRLDAGDETAGQQRRVKTMGQLSLRPTSQELSRLQFDLALAGLDLDLTRARPAPGGVDIVVNCLMAGGTIRVPAGWHVATESRGVGGVSSKTSGQELEGPEATAADVRVHLNAALGGVTVERAGT